MPGVTIDVDGVVVGAGIVGAVCAAGVRVQFVEPTNVALSLASIETYRTFPERHGVQHAPAVGRAIREEIDGRSHTVAIDPLRLSRFAAGAHRVERHLI